jgi:IS30 family transposase
LSLRKIAEQLGRSPSTISRKVERNRGRYKYRATVRGVLKKELISHLRSRRIMRRGKTSTTQGQPRGQIVDAVSISERPAEVDDRAIPEHWEGDLLSGGNNTHIATLVERHSRYVLLVQVKGKDTDNVVTALVKQVKKPPEGLMSSLTWDRGTELAGHRRFTVATDVKVYFCDPRSPWQRGSNEHTNGLLRHLSVYSQADLNVVEAQHTAEKNARLHHAGH